MKRALTFPFVLVLTSTLGLAHAETTYTTTLTVGESVLYQTDTATITLTVTRNDTAFNDYLVNITKDGNDFRTNWNGRVFIDSEAQGHTFNVTGLYDSELDETVDFNTTALDVDDSPTNEPNNETQQSNPFSIINATRYVDFKAFQNETVPIIVIALIAVILGSLAFSAKPKPKPKNETRVLFDNARND